MIARQGLPVHLACRVRVVSEAGCYARRSRSPSARSIRHAWITDVIRQVHAASRETYGIRRVHAELTLGRGVAIGSMHRQWSRHLPRIRSSPNACSSQPTGATAYGFDTRGNRVSQVSSSGSAVCDAYDQADRLTMITSGTGASCTSPTTVGTYTYNGSGLRMSKTVGSTSTQFVWNLYGSLSLPVRDGADA